MSEAVLKPGFNLLEYAHGFCFSGYNSILSRTAPVQKYTFVMVDTVKSLAITRKYREINPLYHDEMSSSFRF